MRYIQDPVTLDLVPAERYRRLGEHHYVQGDHEPYQHPNTGEWISGKVAHREALARSGCHVLEVGEREEILKIHDRKDLDLEKRYMKFCVEYINSKGYFPGE